MSEETQPPLAPLVDSRGCIGLLRFPYVEQDPPDAGELGLTEADFPPWLLAGCMDPCAYYSDDDMLTA